MPSPNLPRLNLKRPCQKVSHQLDTLQDAYLGRTPTTPLKIAMKCLLDLSADKPHFGRKSIIRMGFVVTD